MNFLRLWTLSGKEFDGGTTSIETEAEIKHKIRVFYGNEFNTKTKSTI